MRRVSKDQFFAKIGPRDVVCRPERDAVYWETRGRIIVGKTLPGYMGGYAKEYWLYD